MKRFEGLVGRIVKDAENQDIATVVPQGDAIPGSTVVATITDPDVKRLLGLSMHYQRMARDAKSVALANDGHDETASKHAAAAADEYQTLAVIATNAVSFELKQEYGLFGKLAVGVDQNYQVFYFDQCPGCGQREGVPGLEITVMDMEVISLEDLFGEPYGRRGRGPIPVSLGDLLGMMGRRRR